MVYLTTKIRNNLPISFVKDIELLDSFEKQAKPNRFNAMKIKTKDFKFNREEANER